MQRPSIFVRAALSAWAVAALVSCAPPASPAAPSITNVVLRDDSQATSIGDLVKRDRLTVLLFFTGECPVQKAHDARVRELIALYRPKGVSFIAVVSEVSADLSAERAEAGRRGLGMSVLQDRGAVLADALGVEYSTHAVLLRPSGEVVYSGGIDSDRTHMTDGAQQYLRDAIDATLAGNAVKTSRVEALGCPLRKH